MKKFELTAAFLIGHRKIDSDHEELVTILNDMVEHYEKGDRTRCEQIWQDFAAKLEQHFVTEHQIMAELKFPADDHDAQHDGILDNVRTLGEKCRRSGEWQAFIIEMRSGVLTWILKHDLKFAEYLVTIGYNDNSRD